MRMSQQSFTIHSLAEAVRHTNEQSNDDFIQQNLFVSASVPFPSCKELFEDHTITVSKMCLLMITSGWMEVSLNMEVLRIKAGELVWMAPGSTFRCYSASDDLQARGIIVATELISMAWGNYVPNAFDGRQKNFRLPLHADEQETLAQMLHLLEQYLNGDNLCTKVIYHQLCSIFWQADFIWGQKHEVLQEQSREQKLYADFMQLVNEQVAMHHDVDFYAQKLCLSTRHASKLVRDASGQSAKYWIATILTTYIKEQLKYTDKTISQICDDYNFSHYTAFCKFFRRMTGLSPMEYRMYG